MFPIVQNVRKSNNLQLFTCGSRSTSCYFLNLLLLSKFKGRPYKSPKISETRHGAHIGHQKSYDGVKIDLKCHFQGQKRPKIELCETIRILKWATEREISSFCRKPKERLSKKFISAEIQKEPKDSLSAERGCFCRKMVFLQRIIVILDNELRQIRWNFLPKEAISAERNPFCRKKLFLQKHRKVKLKQKEFLPNFCRNFRPKGHRNALSVAH